MFRPTHRGRLPSVSLRNRRAHISYVASVDVPGSPDSDETELETVPLPRPLSDTSSGDAQLPAQYTSLDDLPPVDSGEGTSATAQSFSLDKTQSLWLLNLVSFVYGTNTTCALSTYSHATRRCIAASRALHIVITQVPLTVACVL